jgi:coproporphyrinogen III oxidase-like Fe-S oxidoreductase
MAAMEKVTIGFFGGGLPLRMESKQLDALLKALPAAGWHDIEAEDGTVRINLATVVYVRTDRAEHRVGFGH